MTNLYVNSCREQSEATIKAFRKWAKSKGYKAERRLQSAMYHLVAYNGTTDYQNMVAAIDGWHGSGKGNRHYGDTFVLFGLYIGPHGGEFITACSTADDLGYKSDAPYGRDFKDDVTKQKYLDRLKAIEKRLETL